MTKDPILTKRIIEQSQEVFSRYMEMIRSKEFIARSPNALINIFKGDLKEEVRTRLLGDDSIRSKQVAMVGFLPQQSKENRALMPRLPAFPLFSHRNNSNVLYQVVIFNLEATRNLHHVNDEEFLHGEFLSREEGRKLATLAARKKNGRNAKKARELGYYYEDSNYIHALKNHLREVFQDYRFTYHTYDFKSSIIDNSVENDNFDKIMNNEDYEVNYDIDDVDEDEDYKQSDSDESTRSEHENKKRKKVTDRKSVV